MAKPHLVSTLETKIAETESRLADYWRRRIEAQRDLANLCGTLSLFERQAQPDVEPQPMSMARIFKRGEIFDICCRELRLRPFGGLETWYFVEACMAEKGLSMSDSFLRASVSQAVSQVLNRRAERGQICRAGKNGVGVIWVLSTGRDNPV